MRMLNLRVTYSLNTPTRGERWRVSHKDSHELPCRELLALRQESWQAREREVAGERAVNVDAQQFTGLRIAESGSGFLQIGEEVGITSIIILIIRRRFDVPLVSPPPSPWSVVS
jgi:hypothetical protein